MGTVTTARPLALAVEELDGVGPEPLGRADPALVGDLPVGHAGAPRRLARRELHVARVGIALPAPGSWAGRGR